MNSIKSCHNSLITELSKLKSNQVRKKSGLFCAEGKKLTLEMLSCGIKPVYCFMSEQAVQNGVIPDIDDSIIYEVSDAVMKKLSTLTTPQDIITVARIPVRSENSYKDSCIIALDSVQDPGNIGAIIRSAEAFGIKTVVLGDGCCDAYSQKVLRGAMGSVFRVNTVQTELTAFLQKMKSDGYDIIGTGLDKDFRTVDRLNESVKKVIVIGNEGNGISDEVKAVCSFGMYIPMLGRNESLNAAAAASIIMWENKKQSDE